jgi:type IV pilus assembly protein PilW
MSAQISRTRSPAFSQAGFSLVEVLVALVLGILVLGGAFMLFTGINSTNKSQQGLARLQENGRFALIRMEDDLRMTAAQYCSTTTGTSPKGTAVPVLPSRAPMVYARDLALPDSNIRSITSTGVPSPSPAAAPYALSPRWFIQGYSCTAAACTPTLPTGAGQIPAMGVAAGARVPASDVLTIRYQRGSGWPIPSLSCSIGSAAPLVDGAVMQVNPQAGDDPLTMGAGLALVSDCVNPAILPIRAVDPATGNLTIGDNILPGATGYLCNGSSARDARVFDFSRDFVTVSYYLVFRADDSPDAQPNSAAAQRLIPVLVRRENGVEQELVRGVDQLAFNYGVQLANGNTTFLSASEIQGAAVTLCSLPAAGMPQDPGCLWRSVRAIEPRLLVNSVDEIPSLTDVERTYRFDDTVVTSPAVSATLPSGVRVGNLSRREFVGYFAVRNGNF